MSNVSAGRATARFSRFKAARLAAQFERYQRAHGTAAAIERLLERARRAVDGSRKPRPGEMNPGVRRLVELVAARHEVPLKLVTGMSRQARAVAARHEAWFRLAACGFSGPGIAKMFCCRPSTLVPALRGFRERFPEKAAEIERAARAPLQVVAAEERRAA